MIGPLNIMLRDAQLDVTFLCFTYATGRASLFTLESEMDAQICRITETRRIMRAGHNSSTVPCSVSA